MLCMRTHVLPNLHTPHHLPQPPRLPALTVQGSALAARLRPGAVQQAPQGGPRGRAMGALPYPTLAGRARGAPARRA